MMLLFLTFFFFVAWCCWVVRGELGVNGAIGS